MTAHLLLVTLGPVQDFIAEARRTRDLWFGSHLLSELGRVAARALTEGGAELVVPALKRGDPELEPCLKPLRATGRPPKNVANKLLAEVPSRIDPRELARRVREDVNTFWRKEVAAPTRTKCAGLLAEGIDSVWDEQIDTFLEFTASWLPLNDYAQTRRKLEEAIAGRKLLRDFPPWRQARGHVPKSSLDGARETVLLPPPKRDQELVRKYRIADSEQLDAIGLVKRAGGEPGQFVPIINIALASWVDVASRLAPSELDDLRNACEKMGISRVARPDLPCAEPFPYDASVLLRSRWRSVFRELGLQSNAEAWGQKHVQPLLDALSPPFPYVACLVADGDRMGRAIDRLCSAADHRALSERLARFAGTVRIVVEQRHRGALVYAGGDDILAFVPLSEALSCADDLRKAFADAMASACSSLDADERPTLSVGLGVGHVVERMGDLLELGRRAEREAKRDRNALAVIVDKRSGGVRSWRARWGADPVRRLYDDIALLKRRLSKQKVYEIGNTLARLPEPCERKDARWARVLVLEVQRSLARNEGGPLQPEDVGLALDSNDDYAKVHACVGNWVERMLIARTFAQAAPRTSRKAEEAAA